MRNKSNRKMPAIWSSSERPISVRTVWVDGVRHAILSRDDPLLSSEVSSRRRPQTSSADEKNKNYSFRLQSCNSAKQSESYFDGCFVKLHLVFDRKKDNQLDFSARGPVRRQSAPICSKIIRSNLYFHSDQVREREAPQCTLINDENCRASYSQFFSSKGKAALEKPSEKLALEQVAVSASETDELQMNTLSERVLQWLDLAGKMQNYGLDDAQRNLFSVQEGKRSTRHTHSKERGNLIRIVMPTQYLVLLSSKNGEKRIVEKQNSRDTFFNSHDISKGRLNVDIGLMKADFCSHGPTKIDKAEESKSRTQSMWTLPVRKPQLHVFIPNLKSTEVHWVSPRESLFPH